jgi:hypothetical protein
MLFKINDEFGGFYFPQPNNAPPKINLKRRIEAVGNHAVQVVVKKASTAIQQVPKLEDSIKEIEAITMDLDAKSAPKQKAVMHGLKAMGNFGRALATNAFSNASHAVLTGAAAVTNKACKAADEVNANIHAFIDGYDN